MEKVKKFIKCDNGDFCVRKKEILNNEKRKIVVFAIAGIHLGLDKDTDFGKESDEILEKEKNNFEEKIVLYEWNGNEFQKVEDIKNKTWFVL